MTNENPKIDSDLWLKFLKDMKAPSRPTDSQGTRAWLDGHPAEKTRMLSPHQGRASGEKKPIGRSRAVRNPAGAFRITGIEFTTTEAVAMSPWVPPGIVRLILGWPFSSTVSTGTFAPTYIWSSRWISSAPLPTPRAIWWTPAAWPGSTV